jgi:hypothetical protein
MDTALDTGAPPRIRLCGIRHHGPGSARAVRRAFDTDPPDIVLIEGPTEATAIAHLANDPEMQPPITMLGYAVDHLDRAAFYPFASFSPEWTALRWAGDADVPVRFIDLALRHALAARGEADTDTDDTLRFGDERPLDPLAELAEAAGYDDAERWWEDVVEHRDGTSPFESIADAMAVLRVAYDPDLVPPTVIERRREAQMRAGIRGAVKDGYRSIAVVCGAWHVPALANALDAKQARSDTATLRGMPKVKAAITWVPWTHRRLASASGYGAGVRSPGWYHHLFTHSGPDMLARWFAEAARVLRASDYAASAADVVEATRLAASLGALRGRPLAGLAEADDAARAVLGDGTDTPMRLLSNELVVGTLIGHVPASTPMVPLVRNLAAEQKACRLKPEAAPRALELDLRRPLDLSRSRLLHRLAVLRVPWGRMAEGRKSAGTFRETWDLVWEPELEVRLIEMSALGTTVAAAATASLIQGSLGAASIAALTASIEYCLLADLTDPLPGIVQLVADRAALDADITHLMGALPALARTIRYGDVRGTDADALVGVVHGMVGRVAAGLVPACTDLDDDAAADMASHVADTHSALSLLGDDALTAAFLRSLAEIAERERVHAGLQGLATRLLADAGAMSAHDVEYRVSRALSSGTPPLDGAAFVEGFLGGSGVALVHDGDLLSVIDRWLCALDAESFVATLPLLRRTFGTFEPAERRQIGERIRHGVAQSADTGSATLDADRVAAVLATINHLLGATR